MPANTRCFASLKIKSQRKIMTQIPPRFSHYQSLRRDNPDLFYQLSTQRQMRDSYVTLGAAFFDAYVKQVRL
jgi:hypothetical protein